MDDTTRVRIIERIVVDVSEAIKNIRQLAKEFNVSNGDIKRLVKEVTQSYKELDHQRDAEGKKAAQEQRMWEQLSRQRETAHKAERAQMQREIAMFEQHEAARSRMDEKKIRDIERTQRAQAGAAAKAQVLQKAQMDAMWDDRRREDAATQQRQEDLMWAQKAKSEAEAKRQTDARMKEEIAYFEHSERARLREFAQNERLAQVERKRATQVEQQAQQERQAAAHKLPSLAAEAAHMQMLLKMGGVADLGLKKAVQGHREKVSTLSKDVGLNKQLTAEQMKQYNVLKQQSHLLHSRIQTVSADQMKSVGGSLMQMLGRRMEWFAAGNLFYGFQNTLRGAVNDVSDIEMRMVQLDRVMEDPLYKTEQMRDNIFALGQEFGFTFQQVHDIVLRWAQAGHDASEAIEETRSSLLALNTAELNSEQATQSLIGIMAQWGLKADQLTAVIDRVNKVADDYAVSSQDIVDGLLRSSSAARNANMSLEQTVALLTAMKEASGRSGKEVGNAMNSIIAYIQRAKSLETLEAAKIPVFEDASKQKLRSTFDLLQDLSANWDKLQEDTKQSFMEEAEAAGLFTENIAEASGALEEWTDLQKRDITQSAAGVYRRNYLLALLKNFSQVYDVLNTQERSLGYSQRENQKTMDTAIKQFAALKAELQQAGYAIVGESGILPALKALTQGIKQGVDWFNKLPDSLKQVVIWLGIIGSTLGIANLVSRQFFGATILEGVRAARVAIRGLAWDVARLVTSLGGIGPALLKLSPVAAVLAGITYGIYYMNQQANRLQKALEETQEAMQTALKSAEAEVKVHSANATAVATLTDEYRALSKQRETLAKFFGEDDQQEIAVRQRQILNELKDMLDEESYARLVAANLAEEASDAVAQAEKKKAEAAREAVEKHTKAYRDALRDQINTTLKSLDMIEAQTDGWMTFLTASERATVVWGTGLQKVHLAVANSLRWLFGIANDLYGWLAEKLGAFAEKAGSFDGADFIPGVKQARELASGLAESLSTGADKMADLSKRMEENADSIAKSVIQGVGTLVGAPFGASPSLLDPDGMADKADKAVDAARTRLRKLLIELQSEVDGLSPTKTPGADTDGGEFGTGDDKTGNGVSSIVDGIVAETEALGKLDAETERHIKLVQARIAYNTREGATLAELQKADEDRASLLETLATRQGNLHEQAEAARTAYASLAEMQGKVNRSTEDGEKAYGEIGKAMERMLGIAGDASAEWWGIEREKADLQRENNAISVLTIRRLQELKEQYDDGAISLSEYTKSLRLLGEQSGLSAEATKKLSNELGGALQLRLGELKEAYDNGTLSLRDYIASLEQLESQTGMTAEATKRLNEAQAEAFKKQWTTDIANAVAKEKERIEKDIKTIDAALQHFAELGKYDDRNAARSALTKARNTMNGAVSSASMPSVSEIDSLAANVFDNFESLDFGDLSPEGFAKIIGTDLSMLRDFSTQAQGYLERVGEAAARRLEEISNELQDIDTWLEDRLTALQAELDALDQQDQQDERAKSTDEHNKRQKTLQDDLNWYLLQGEDYRFEIAAIRKQLAEEEEQWSKQQSDWEKQDKRQEIQGRMEEAREEARIRREALEEERKVLQEQQAAMTESLNAILQYIASEMAARKQALEDEKKELSDTSSELDETMKGVNEDVVGTLSFMASQDPEFYKRAQSLITKLINGISSKKGALQEAVQEINQVIDSMKSVPGSSGGGTSTTTPPSTSGPSTIPGNKFTPMASGAFVRGGRGGVLALIGEGRDDELVMARSHAVPMLSAALTTAISRLPSQFSLSMGSGMAAEIGRSVRQALQDISFYGAFDLRLPDGTIQREVIRVFNGFGQVTRG